MDSKHIRRSNGTIMACAALVLIGTAAGSLRAYADDGDEARIRRGFEMAPVPLNLAHKNRALVGLGSYLVNGAGDCNGCHTASPQTEYAPGGNPYFKGNPPKVVNQDTYLGGGMSFGSLIPGTPEIVTRNLTPDKTGRAVGGDTFAQFRHTIRTGLDPDHLHPNCSGPSTPTCFGTDQPFNGDLLQVMPWPNFKDMTDRDLRAIYEYLSSIPCIAGPPTGELHHDCS
jgi:hypothetical protein